MKKINWKSFFQWFLFSITTILIFLLFYFIFDKIVMPLYTRHSQQVVVPDITNKSMRVSEKLLKDSKLNLVVHEEKFDSNYPPGFVLFQNPAPGSKVKKGRRIYLTVGKGQQIIEMPQLIGNSERDAKFILSQNKLVLKNIKYKNDNEYLVGVTCNQSVSPGEMIAVGEEINITVSLGRDPNRVIVPEVVGKSLKDAIYSLKSAGLFITEYEYQSTDKVLPNTVLGQSLSPGTQVTKNDSIRLVLSKLPGNVDEEKLQW